MTATSTPPDTSPSAGHTEARGERRTRTRRRLAGLSFVGVLGLLLGAGLAVVLGGTSGDERTAAPPTAADIGFSQDMAVHHEQAIDMATLASQKASPAVRFLATAIQLSQAREAGMMRGWLQLWGAPQLPNGPPMSWSNHGQIGTSSASDTAHHTMSHPGHAPGSGSTTPMPGMATQQELNQLSTKNGAEFDIMFLQLMIRHHQGGVLMAQDAGDVITIPAIRHFALSIIATQNDEISAMSTYLLRNGAPPLPPPG